MRAARRRAGAGAGKLGKVLVLPGIMGTELDSVDRKGDSDRIWINFVRLIAGRIGDLELAPTGSPRSRGVHVRPAGRPPQDVRADAPRAGHALARAAVPVRLARGHRQERRAARRRGQGVRRRGARCISSPTRWAASSRGGSSSAHRDDVEGDGRRERRRAWRAPRHARNAEPRLVRDPADALGRRRSS